ncbi:dnaJ homolog subfamily C member 28 [Genypterus blacodes]|uniref:dnaJ homolog subfamily C member 28 n=1 Tax=Genypterus blacodes TaxID=154954 RepID=UPI003F75C82D
METRQMLLESLQRLSDPEHERFKYVLIDRPHCRKRRMMAEMQSTVFQIVLTFRKHSVKMISDILDKIHRSDLVRRLSGISLGPPGRTSVDEKVASMRTITERLLEAQNDLTIVEMYAFREHYSGELGNRLTTVSHLMKLYGKKCVHVTSRILDNIHREDLAQRLDSLSHWRVEDQEKHSVDKHQTALIQKVATVAAVKDLILGSLNDLRDGDFETFKVLLLQEDLPGPLIGPLGITHRKTVMDLMVDRLSERSLEVTEKIFKKMNRNDLIQSFSNLGLGHTETCQSALIKRDTHVSGLTAISLHFNHAETAETAIIELLLEILNELTIDELKKFTHHMNTLYPWGRMEDLKGANRLSTVDLMIETYGQRCVEEAGDILQMLSDTSSSSEDESGRKTSVKEKQSRVAFPSAHKEEAEETSREKLRRTFRCLSRQGLQTFNCFLIGRFDQMGLFLHLGGRGGVEDTVDLMMRTFGQQCVNVAEDILIKMKRHDLVQMLSDTSSGPEDESGGKTSVKEKQSRWAFSSAHKEATMETRQMLLESLQRLSDPEHERFKYVLIDRPHCRKRRMMAEMQSTVFQIVLTFRKHSVKMISDILDKIHRSDLVRRLSGISLGPPGRTSVDEKVASMRTITERLLEAQNDLTIVEMYAFREHYSGELGNRLTTVSHLMKLYGKKCVHVTSRILDNIHREDLAQRLDSLSHWRVEDQEKHSVDKHQTALIQKVATVAAVKDLILGSLNDLRDGDFETFKVLLLQEDLPGPLIGPLGITHRKTVMDLMVDRLSERSLEVTEKIFKKMNRNDLIQSFSNLGLGHTETCQSALIKRDTHVSGLTAISLHFNHAETAETAIIELLLEILNELTIDELKKFTHHMNTLYPWGRMEDLKGANRLSTVDLMIETYGQRCVEEAGDILQMLSDTSSSSEDESGRKTSVKEKQSRVAFPSAHKEEAEETSREKLRRTFRCLSRQGLQTFNCFLIGRFDQMGLFLHLGGRGGVEDTVDLMMRTFGQQCVNVAEDILIKMKRHDLVQMLSDTSSGPEDESGGKTSVKEKQSRVAFPSAHKEEAEETSREKLRRTFRCLSRQGLQTFNCFLIGRFDQMGLFLHLGGRGGVEDTVDLMMRTFGQQCVNVAEDILIKMKRHDLVQMLSDTSSGPEDESGGKTSVKEKQSRVAFPSAHKEEAEETSREKLRRTFRCLSRRGLKTFNLFLVRRLKKTGLFLYLRWSRDVEDTVDLMMRSFGQQCVNVAEAILIKMKRHDLVQMLSDTSSGPEDESGGKSSDKGPEESPEPCGSVVQKSAVWTKVQAEVSSVDETPTYSLQSEAGHFECSMSGLRWVCHERVTIKYQLNTWLEHRERLAGTGYTPAGPLLDITIADGKLEEVYLPHWICIEDISDVSDKFAVLHMDLCGDAVEVEQVSEVTPSHVKLTKPHFSLKGILIRLGFQQRVYCYMLIYSSSEAFLTLHVYLIQRDPGLRQAINKERLSSGYKIIVKPHPVEPLKIKNRFFLTANLDTAVISPAANLLTIEEDPNFYEVFVENPDTHIMLTLGNSRGPVWTHEIRKDEYQSRNPAAAPAAGGSSSGAAGGSASGAAGGSSSGAAGPLSTVQEVASMSCTFNLLLVRKNICHGRLLLTSARWSLMVRTLSTVPQISRSLRESYMLLQLPDEGSSSPAQVKEAYLRLAKLYHPDSSAPTADAALFAQVEGAYRAVLAHQSQTKRSEPEKEVDDDGKFKGAALQHRHYLNYEGVGSGTPSQRERQYRQVRVDRAAEQVLNHRQREHERAAASDGALVERDMRQRSQKIKLTQAVERLVEDLIQESMARGDFRNLSGAGRPLNKFEHNPYADPMTHNLNRILIDNGYQPSWVVTQRDIRETKTQIRDRLLEGRAKKGDPMTPKEHSQWEQLCASVEEDLGKLNKMVDNFNLIVPTLSMQMVHFSLSREIDRAETGASQERERKRRREENKRGTAKNKPENSKQGLMSWMQNLLR